jgi:UDP-N-acetylglucosamine--N-acetylmuramyl-(pentapeptide) pyrophosphoryl-undecaprenol N-acetylglucosamine transferase
MNKDLSRPIIVTAGGTGGHVFPAESLAEELNARGERVVLITDKRFISHISGDNLADIHTITSGRMGKGVIGIVSTAFLVMMGTLQAMWLMLKLKPKAVVGFGGYPAFPSMLAATILGIPTIIHEQNAVLGRANRKLLNRVTAVATSFAHTMMIDDVNQLKTTLTGNPVRSSIRALAHLPYPELHADSPLHILVIGGSQGAAIFSRIVPAALATLPVSVRSRLRIDQQCRTEDLEVAQEAYKQLGISANLSSFFSDIPLKLASAHLVISRAGASSLTELAAAGRPAILVPLPSAMDNHQTINANAFEDAGASWVMAQDGFTAAALSARLETFLSTPQILVEAAKKARTLGNIHAAEHLADVVQKQSK